MDESTSTLLRQIDVETLRSSVSRRWAPPRSPTRRNADGTGWMVLADPAGDHFCIVGSDEERSFG